MREEVRANVSDFALEPQDPDGDRHGSRRTGLGRTHQGFTVGPGFLAFESLVISAFIISGGMVEVVSFGIPSSIPPPPQPDTPSAAMTDPQHRILATLRFIEGSPESS
jgi:hypothetical protein